VLLKDIDLGYVAGLLEGEGFFDATNRLCITCTMTDEEPIKKLFDICGGSYYGLHHHTKSGKPTYRWYIGRRRGSIELAKLLFPLMCPRRQIQLQAMLDKDKTQHKNNWTLVHGTLQGYESHKCRCNECKAAESRYRKNLKERKKIL